MKTNSKKKLTHESIAAIRVRAQEGESIAVLAREFSVHRSAIYYHVNHGKLPPAAASPYARSIEQAINARRAGNNELAARFLRAAADHLSP